MVTIYIGKDRVFKIPEIGVQATCRREPLTAKEAEILRRFSFDHLRSEIHLFRPGWKTELERSIAESQWLGIPLFWVLCFSENKHEEFAQLREEVSRVAVPVKYVLMVGENHITGDDLSESVYPLIKSVFPEAKTGTGVNAYFAELNRNRPKTEKSDFIGFSVCPQVHASDDLSLVENLEAQQHVVESAKNLFPGKPVFVSPVTLKQRFNVVATLEETIPGPGELPEQVDVRQHSVFAAQWLLGSLKFLAQSGADLVTYFETAGWRGFIQGDFKPPLPERFPARKGDVFPVFQLLNELAGFKRVIYCESNEPLKVEAIVLYDPDAENAKILMANFTGEKQRIRLNTVEQIITAHDIFTGERLHHHSHQIEMGERSMMQAELKV